MEQFTGTNLIDFIDRFPNEEKCKSYLAHIRWGLGFECSKCGHHQYWMKKSDPFIRICKACRHGNSVTANTLFHKLKFDLRKAFLILFEMATTTKGCSSPVIARKYGLNQKTAWLFMTKVRKAMASRGSHPIKGHCEVDEILIGEKRAGQTGRAGEDKKKAAIVVEKAVWGGFRRAYGVRIANFSTSEIRKIFQRHIHSDASVETDMWKAYRPLDYLWAIRQVKSKPGENFRLIHRFVQQLKGWIRGIYHHVSDDYLQGYLDEFCYRLNRHSSKGANFNRLVVRMVAHQPVPRRNLIFQ